jgi:hypothetical protein
MQPVEMALAGIPGAWAVAGSWANARPPRRLIARTPSLPSCSMPLSTKPIRWAGRCLTAGNQ